MLKKILKNTINLIFDYLRNTRIGNFIFRRVLEDAMQQISEVSHNGIELKFTVPGPLTKYRADSFSIKEPETLEWIESFEEDCNFWDIGANVGLYSCYAAKLKNSTVYAFEPSVFNLELLARNIYINNLVDNIIIFSLPLSNSLSCDKLNMTSTQWGGALSTFGQEYGQDGKNLDSIFQFKTFSIPMDILFKDFKLPRPDYIKMDVDGIEHLILDGGANILKHVKGVLIEIDDDFIEQSSQSMQLLKNAGLKLLEKKQSNALMGSSMYNQIWTRLE